jgi:hypothetical protein
MKKKNRIESGVKTRSIKQIKLKPKDRKTLEAMAKRYEVVDLIDFLEGIVIVEQGPNVVASFYDV